MQVWKNEIMELQVWRIRVENCVCMTSSLLIIRCWLYIYCMLQIVYVCDRVLSPLDRIAILGTNHSTIYTFFPRERFIISMFKCNFIMSIRFIWRISNTTGTHTRSNLRRRKLNFESIKLLTTYHTIFVKLCIYLINRRRWSIFF